MKKLLTTLLVLLMVMGFCFAGGGSETKSEAAAPAAESHIPTGEAPKEKVHIIFWTNMSGDSQICTEDAAKAFNASQDTYEVEVIYTSNIPTKMLTSTVWWPIISASTVSSSWGRGRTRRPCLPWRPTSARRGFWSRCTAAAKRWSRRSGRRLTI